MRIKPNAQIDVSSTENNHFNLSSGNCIPCLVRSIDSRVVFYFLLIKLNVQFQNIITKETIRLQNDLESEFIYQQLLSDIITEVLKTSKFSGVIRGFSDGICEFVD